MGESLSCRTVIVFIALTSDFQIHLAITIHIVQPKPKASRRFSQNLSRRYKLRDFKSKHGWQISFVRELENVFHVPCILMLHFIEKLLTTLVDVKNVLSVPYLALPVDIYERCTNVLFCACQTMTFGGNLAPCIILDPLHRDSHNISQSRTSGKRYLLVKEIFTQNTRQSIEMPLPPQYLKRSAFPVGNPLLIIT